MQSPFQNPKPKLAWGILTLLLFKYLLTMRLYSSQDKTRLLPSVTTILSATKPEADRLALERWRRQVGVIQAEQVSTAATNRGTAMHTLCEQLLTGQPLGEPDATTAPFWNSIRPALMTLKVTHTEKVVEHLELGYAGTLDAWGLYQGKTTIIDFKTSSRAKKIDWIQDYCIQAVAYAGALRAMTEESSEQALILIALAGTPCQKFLLSRQEMGYYWHLWLIRIQLFYSLPEVIELLAQSSKVEA